MKITKTTIKSFIKKNENNLFVKVESTFDGMVDCVMPTKDNFKKVAVKTIENQRDEHTLGVTGLYLVGSSRDYFTAYEDEKYIGFEVYNCCGSSIIATLK
jgi:hypothetical protein